MSSLVDRRGFLGLLTALPFVRWDRIGPAIPAPPPVQFIISAADVFVSDFGTIRIIPNRFQRDRDAWTIDWSELEKIEWRPGEVSS